MKSATSQSQSQYFILQLVIVTISIVLVVTSILYNNSPRSVAIFLFLLAAGIAMQAVLGMRRGGIPALLICSIAILIKQFIGAWEGDNLEFNLIEVFLMAGTFILVGRFNDALQTYFEEFADAKQQLKILDLQDTSVGLIRSAIGLLRLKEEVDRAIRFKRPISLVLILTSPPADRDWSTTERLSVMRTIATTVKDTTRVLDIPFMASEDKVALILVDTEINGSNKVINNVQRQFINSRIITRSGLSEPLQEHAQIRFGYAVFLGQSSKSFDLMEAAELSLQRNIEMNTGAIFQNLFIDWEIIGESAIFQTILPSSNAILDSSSPSISAIENSNNGSS